MHVLIYRWTVTLSNVQSVSLLLNSLLLGSSYILVLAFTGVVTGWLTSFGPVVHTPSLQYPGSPCPVGSVLWGCVTFHGAQPSSFLQLPLVHAAGIRRGYTLLLSDHERENPKNRLLQDQELAPKLFGQEFTRSEVQRKWFRKSVVGFGWALPLVLWTQCPMKSHGLNRAKMGLSNCGIWESSAVS